MVLGNEKGAPILVYFDYASKVFVPLCTKADCSHLSGDMGCTANLLARSLKGVCEYQGQLWYLKTKTEGRQSMNDPLYTTLCRADLTGENEEELYTWEINVSEGSVLYDGYFYCVDTQNYYDENLQLMGFKERLLRIDLENVDMAAIEEKEETQQRLYRILGFREGKLYYQCYPGKNYPEGVVMTYDCKNQEKEAFPLAEGELRIAALEEDYLTYSILDREQTVMYIVDLEDKEEVMSLPIDFYASYDILDGEVWVGQYRQKYEIYNLETKEYREIAERNDLTRGFSTGDGYVGQVIDGNDYVTEYAYISKEDFEKGGAPTIITKDEYPIW
ncbi:MAG: hypothetical protein HFI93_03895 [Lachnospiraceae bacterium]|nr:hypothetical protein [Lachnospiraceae bacterium]